MKEARPQPCPECARPQTLLDQLREQLERQRGQVEDLQASAARLRERLAEARKDSSTSSKPPSSDIVKPPPPPDAAPRAFGGQPGHPKHERPAFPPEAPTCPPYSHTIEICPDCGCGLEPADAAKPRVVRKIDIRDIPLVIHEYRFGMFVAKPSETPRIVVRKR